MKKITILLTALLVTLSVASFSNNFVAAANKKECIGVETSIIKCDAKKDDKTGNIKKTAIWEILSIGVNILTGGVAIAALGGIVWGSILYTSSSANPETKKKAISILTNVAIGIVAYAAMYVILNFLVPGGVGI